MYKDNVIKRTRKVKEMEDRVGMSVEAFVYSMYVEKHCNTTTIAKALGTTPTTVCTFLDKMGIERRKMIYA